jgi:hypothetical protein
MQKLCIDYSTQNMSILSNFADISISLPQLGIGWRSSLFADICEAARTGAYVETYGHKADTLHKYLSSSDERVLKQAYEIQVRKLLSGLRIKKVELAIDGKKDLYYGKNGSINVRGIVSEHGADEVWEYVVVSIIHPIKLPLMAIRYPMGADLAKCCIELLEYARCLPITIEKILFDRGFYNGYLIDYLESRKQGKPLPYLIFAPKNEAIERYASQLEHNFGVFKHVVRYNREKTVFETPTTIVTCKNAGTNEKGEPYDWYFATNLKPSYNLVRQYRRRWNIETGFRIMEKGKIMTNSNKPVVRLFYFLLRALFSAIWVLSNVRRFYMTFKRFLKQVEIDLRKFEVNKPPVIKPIY